jgi:hypothetical protein
MNDEETKILNTGNPAQETERKENAEIQQEVANNKPTTGKGTKAAYAAGGFAAGVAAGAAGSAAAANHKEESIDVVADGVENEPTSDEAQQQETAQQEAASQHEAVQEAPSPQEAIVATSEGVKVAQVNDDVSFNEAFADARAQVGAGGVFEWHGHVYSTYYEEEWSKMSSAEKADYQAKIDYSAVTDGSDATYTASNNTASTHTATQHEHVAVDTDQPAMDTNATLVDNQPDSAEIKVLGVEVVQDGSGQQMTVAALNVDGHSSLMVDVDMDGQMDLLAVDVNDNGQIDEGEAANIQDWNVSVSDIAQQAPGSDAYLAQNDGMPDYMNDADVSSLA